jgi:hypothetical protein
MLLAGGVLLFVAAVGQRSPAAGIVAVALLLFFLLYFALPLGLRLLAWWEVRHHDQAGITEVTPTVSAIRD